MISHRSAIKLASGFGDGFSDAKVNAEELKRAADKTLAAHGDTLKRPTIYDKARHEPSERLARLRSLAIARGEYKPHP